MDEAALTEALQEGLIAGAALDCFSVKPLPMDHPLQSEANTLLVPHPGWMTVEAREGMLSEPVDIIVAWLSGRPRKVVAGPIKG